MSLFRTWYSRSITWYRPARRMTWDWRQRLGLTVSGAGASSAM